MRPVFRSHHSVVFWYANGSAEITSPGRTVDDVHPRVAVGMRQHLSQLAVDVQIQQDVLVHAVVIVIIVRVNLIGPDRLAGFRPARK